MVGCHDESQPISSLEGLPGGVSIAEVRPGVSERARSTVSAFGRPGRTLCLSSGVQRRSRLFIRWRSAARLSKKTKLKVPTKALPATKRRVKGKHDTCCCFRISLLLMNGLTGRIQKEILLEKKVFGNCKLMLRG